MRSTKLADMLKDPTCFKVEIVPKNGVNVLYLNNLYEFPLFYDAEHGLIMDEKGG